MVSEGFTGRLKRKMKKILFLLLVVGDCFGQLPPNQVYMGAYVGTSLPVLCNNRDLFYNVNTYVWYTCGPANTWNVAFPASGTAFTLTTTGSSGPATYSSNVLNIPQYSGSSMVYPGAGVANSTGSAWGASYTVGVGNNNLVQLNGSSQLPAVSATLLTNLPITLTTTGSSGASTYTAGTNTLNIPQYTNGGGATIPSTTNVLIGSGSGNGADSGHPNTTGAFVGTTDTQTLTNKTVDGVTPVTFGYVDATSSIQTQLNGKAASTASTVVNGIPCVLGSTCSVPAGVPGTSVPGTSVTLSGNSQVYVCTGTCSVTVLAPTINVQYCVLNDDNVATVITLNAITGVQYENTARTAYGTITTGTLSSSGAVGDAVCIIGRDTTHYLTVSFKGTWTAS